jgi:hypothetical protein
MFEVAGCSLLVDLLAGEIGSNSVVIHRYSL